MVVETLRTDLGLLRTSIQSAAVCLSHGCTGQLTDSEIRQQAAGWTEEEMMT